MILYAVADINEPHVFFNLRKESFTKLEPSCLFPTQELARQFIHQLLCKDNFVTEIHVLIEQETILMGYRSKEFSIIGR